MASLDVAKQLNVDIQKKLFRLKLPNTEGLVLHILQTSNRKSTRFIQSDFQAKGNILALANNDAHIYIIDFLNGKFWKLEKLEPCTCIKLSECNESQLFVAKTSGVLEILDIDSGEVISKLLGHQHPVVSISFSQSYICLSSSKYEAIIWDLTSYSKLQVLSLEKECALKFVLFVPISNHILVCYKDDVIQIWKNGSFEILKQFHPSNWKNYSVKSLSFTRNGKVMAVGGYLPILAIFQLDIWKLLKLVHLPEHINTVKKIQFMPQNFDGGCNKLLAVLSGSGIIYFYNIEDNILLSTLKCKCEIINFTLPSANAYVSCVLHSGDVEVYDINFYVMKNVKTVIERAQEGDKRGNSKLKLKNFCRKSDVLSKLQMENILEFDKLKAIIKEYREFPEAFRATIWERVLKLPNNIRQYNSFVNNMGVIAFEDLQKHFPLEDKVTIRCLRLVLNNIVTWCPFFAQVEFLPCLLFPFVKVFHKKPIACFELCCTVIVNWCQHWFEYHPLPPVNVLAIIDNMLMEHDSSSLRHFSQCSVKPILYSWSLLETAFSEVFTASEWLMFWDHVFINEPSFLLCGVVAFNMLQKKHFLLLTKEDEFYQLFHSQRPLDVRKFISKTYWVLDKTSERNHPRQYLNMFTCLTCGSYPSFEDYPKEVVNFQVEHVNYLENQLTEAKHLKQNLLKEMQNQRSHNEIDLKNEEDRRMIEVEKACIQRIRNYQENLMTQQSELKSLRRELLNQEEAIVRNAQKKFKKHKSGENIGTMQLLADGLDMSKKMNDIELNNLEEAYRLELLGLTRKGQYLEENKIGHDLSLYLTSRLSSAQQDTVKLKNQINRAKISLGSPRKADIALVISTLSELISKIKSELVVNKVSTQYDSLKEHLKVQQLEKETNDLRKEISRLLRLLNEKGDIEECYPDSGYSKKRTYPSRTVRFNASGY